MPYNKKVQEQVEKWMSVVNNGPINAFLDLVESEPCIKDKIITEYKRIGNSIYRTDGTSSGYNAYYLGVIKQINADESTGIRTAARFLYTGNYARTSVWFEDVFNQCALSKVLDEWIDEDSGIAVYPTQNIGNDIGPVPTDSPFDMRLRRIEKSIHDSKEIGFLSMPYSSALAQSSTSGYIMTGQALKDLDNEKMQGQVALLEEQMQRDPLYQGVPALQNYYALVKLYGTDAGKYIINKRGERKWYEVDQVIDDNYLNYSSTPTTSALISWGSGDPHGRTPYQFTDFVFCKYWNKIANNRLITLRRYAAPILDNLKFPGMQYDNNNVAFPPMATAVTYFGGDSQNSLNSILKFTSGLPWEDVEAAIWEVTSDTTADSAAGPGSVFGGLGKLAQKLNVLSGTVNDQDRELWMNQGKLPPDPYKNGPYENRIMGPINRIDKVKKRKPGLSFQWDGISLVFEYVSRPVGGINPKAVLLDILSNFMIMGSASAVFFGGAHRFMIDPPRHPFMGGNKGIEQWYRGDPISWGKSTFDHFTGVEQQEGGGTGTIQASGENLFSSIKGFFDSLFSGGNIFEAAKGTSVGTNLATDFVAGKSGAIPYLQGMKAILTGEPVGEWHVTIGNPLNPIAMIGNLICENITVEFNEELGPDDFPTEMKITVKLNHAMDRDRDAIQSVFNRGMGRIYDLPDGFLGSADKQTIVDQFTRGQETTGTAPDPRKNYLYQSGLTGRVLNLSEGTNVLGNGVSVWSPVSFNIPVSSLPTEEALSSTYTSTYRAVDWIALKSLG